MVVVGDAILLTLILAAAAMSMRDSADKGRAVEFQRRVLGMVGHDLRNPLSVVSMSAVQLARGGASGDRTQAWVGRITAAANRMDRLIRDLLDGSRIELGIALPLDIRKGDADKSCVRILEDFRAINPTREIQYAPGDAAEVEWDPDRIEQVLENLVANALKYSPEATPVRLGWRRAESAIVIEVANRGRAHSERSFAARVRTVPAWPTTRRGRGQEWHRARPLHRSPHRATARGSIAVRSSAENGTTFTLTLPQEAPRPPLVPRVGATDKASHDVC